jgi:hypothetical protein
LISQLITQGAPNTRPKITAPAENVPKRRFVDCDQFLKRYLNGPNGNGKSGGGRKKA